VTWLVNYNEKQIASNGQKCVQWQQCTLLRRKKKIQIIFLNYYSIVNVLLKLSIVSMSPLKLSKNVNVPLNDKNTIHKIINLKKKN
jgi:ABC-type glutathione transport system ATPase component